MIGFAFYLRLPGMARSTRFVSIKGVKNYLRANHRVDPVLSRKWIAVGVGRSLTMKFVFDLANGEREKEIVGVVFRKRESVGYSGKD